VVDVMDGKSTSGTTVVAARAETMLAAGLKKLSGKSDLTAAWKNLIPGFSSSMRIGIKVNCLNRHLSNSPVFVKALVATLVKDLGADASRIIVWDRRADELQRAGLTAASVGAKVLGTTGGKGPGYESQTRTVGSQTTHLSKILTRETDITIDLPLLKSHPYGALTGALKNAYGIIDNPWHFHADWQNSLAGVFALDEIRKSVRLSITEAFFAVATGGPMGPITHASNRILLARDPVALDAHAVMILEGLLGSTIPASQIQWLARAESLKLGSRSYKPELIKLS